MYKKWTLSIIKYILGTYFLFILVVNFIIDPYGEFNLIKEKNFNEKKFSSSYETIPFVLSDKLNYKQYNLVFGTSRSSLISKELLDEDVLNFSASIYGNPIDVYNVLRQLNSKQLKNIKSIYYLIDTHTFNSKSSIYTTLNLDSKKDFILQSITNLNIDKIKLAYNTLIQNISGKYTYYISEFGAKVPVIENSFSGKISKDAKMRIPFSNSIAIEHLSKIDKFCKNNGIKIIYFTTIYNIPYLKRCNMDLYKEQYKKFLSVLDSFYDFHYTEDVSLKNSLFSNMDHINVEGMKEHLRLLKSLDTNITISNKYLITKENIDAHFIKLKNHIKKF